MSELRWENIIAVTNRHLCARPFPEQLERVCALGPKAVILREKDLPEEEYLALAAAAQEICGRYGTPLTLHFYPEAARKLGIRAVHSPLWKLKEESAKENLEDFVQVGCSVHSVREAEEACACGAGYLTAGHIFETDCKKGLEGRGTAFLKEVCENVPVPVYAIGGMKPEEEMVREMRSFGAAGICVMSAAMKC